MYKFKLSLLAQRGASMVEMGFLIALIAIAVIGASSTLGAKSGAAFARAACDLDGGGSASTLPCEEVHGPSGFGPTPPPAY